jgi:hypothetical protein
VAYKPIYLSNELPKPGPLPEDLRFDMKMMLSQHAADVVLACDVAAFANAAGGVLLIGANEHPNGSGMLSGYAPMTYEEANAVANTLANALRLSSPRPIASAQVIQRKDEPDKYVVAINCEPYAAPPIGVTQAKDGGEKWWVFPVRRGKDNHNLRPEELATIMDPKLRRTILLLERIPSLQPNFLPIATFHSKQDPNDNGRSLNIVLIDHEASCMRLRTVQQIAELLVPLDAVRMIWKDPDYGGFHVSLDGRLIETNSGLRFFP